jgi:6-phosphogluconolactonase
LSKKIRIHDFKLLEELSIKAKNYFMKFYDEGFYNFVIPGGNTPKLFYKMISKLDIDWSKITLILSDERLVPFNHEQSNYLMLKNNLLDNLDEYNKPKIYPEMNLFNDRIDEFLKKTNIAITKIQYIDIAFLGLGFDGHTASLFPGYKYRSEFNSPYFHIKKSDSKVDRISLDLDFLSRLSRLIFLVSGKEKTKALHSLINYKHNKLPISELIKASKAEVNVLSTRVLKK